MDTTERLERVAARLEQLVQVGVDLAAAFKQEKDDQPTLNFEVVNAENSILGFPTGSFFN